MCEDNSSIISKTTPLVNMLKGDGMSKTHLYSAKDGEFNKYDHIGTVLVHVLSGK